MTQQWTKSVAEVEVEDVDTGDILAPLKKLRERYIKKSDKIVESAHGEGAREKLLASVYYLNAAAAVNALIEQSN